VDGYELNGAVIGRLAPDQAGRRLEDEQPPDCHDHSVQRRAAGERPDREALDDVAERAAHDDRGDEADERRIAHDRRDLVGEEGAEHRHRALREVEHARHAVDQDEADRREGVCAPERDPDDRVTREQTPFDGPEHPHLDPLSAHQKQFHPDVVCHLPLLLWSHCRQCSGSWFPGP
jgi:hypothetical protein